MSNIWEITNKDIENLDAFQLTSVLRELLYCEAKANNIPDSAVQCSLGIIVADGGDDGSVSWNGSPESTGWFPNKNIIFQCKATNFTRAQCASEIIAVSPTEVKLLPVIKQLFDHGCLYILFTRQSCSAKQIRERIAGFQDGIRMAGEPYSETAAIEVYDANKIAKWVSQYIKLVLLVLEYIKRSIPAEFKTWTQWSKYADFKFKYEIDEKLKADIEQLRQYLSSPQKVARIVGLSGLGKTRLALEVFRESYSNVAYYDASRSETSLISSLSSWITMGVTGVIVVDDCSIDLHLRCMREIKNTDSRLSLLSIDYSTDICAGDYIKIQIQPSSNEVISNLIIQAYPSLSRTDVDRVVNFSQGFPQIAVLLADARIKNEESIGSLSDDILVRKLLWGRENEDETKLEVIRACSIFDHLGFLESVIEQRKYVAEKLCNITDLQFYKIISYFKKRGIIDSRGKYIKVTPLPLAIRLAADWWTNNPPDITTELFFKGGVPDSMIESLGEQLSNLHFIPNAKEVVKRLCGDKAPFGQAEVIMSKKGSNLFRALVDVNPNETTQTLYNIFINISIPDLTTFIEGRRNIVWALEKLCLWEETFSRAAVVLLILAVAENETWSNNATGQLLSLFHIYLSGTQVAPLSRLTVVEYALSKQDPLFDNMAIEMLGSALLSDRYTGSMITNNRGTRANLDEWKPVKWGDIFIYWKTCLNQLVNIAQNNCVYVTHVAKMISKHARGLLNYYNIYESLISAIVEINKLLNNYWPEMIENLENLLKYEKDKFTPSKINQIENLLLLLLPKTLADRIRLTVCIPPWDDIDDIDKEIYQLAEECSHNLDTFYSIVPILFSGEQRQGAAFGKALSEHLNQKKMFVNSCINAIRSIPTENVNTAVLASYLFAIKETCQELVTDTLFRISTEKDLSIYYIDIIAVLNPTYKDLHTISLMVTQRIIPLSKVRRLAYGSVLRDIHFEDIAEFCKSIMPLGVEAKLISLDILSMYSHNDENRFEALTPVFKEIVVSCDVLKKLDGYASMDGFAWESTVSKILMVHTLDIDFAVEITRNIISCINSDDIFVYEMPIKKIIKLLIKNYGELTWPIFSDVLLFDKTVEHYKLTNLLGPSMSIHEPENSIFQDLPEQFILDWCAKIPDRAPQIACELLPVFTEQNEAFFLNGTLVKIIEKYYANKNLLNIVGSNIHPHSWSGSIVPYLEKRIVAINSIANNKNPIISRWVFKVIEHLNEEIRKGKIEDEEREIGIY